MRTNGELMVEQIEVNYWYPYVERYLKIHNLDPTKSNIEEALIYHNKKLPIQLKNFPPGLIDKLVVLLDKSQKTKI